VDAKAARLGVTMDTINLIAACLLYFGSFLVATFLVMWVVYIIEFLATVVSSIIHAGRPLA
jgi:hypothetical protein